MQWNENIKRKVIGIQNMLPEIFWFVFTLFYILLSEWILGLGKVVYVIFRRLSTAESLFMELLLSAFYIGEMPKISANAAECLPFHVLL